MTQFKEKAVAQDGLPCRAFLTYPVLMAGDILLYETARSGRRRPAPAPRVDASDRGALLNNRYGPTFVVPVGVQPKVAARVMDLQEPTRKMSKVDLEPDGFDLRHRFGR